MLIFNPPHPGETIRESCLGPLELTVKEAAAALGVSRQALSAILNGRAGISPEMAVRLSLAFGSSARHWLEVQMNYDLWQAEQKAESLGVERVEGVTRVRELGPVYGTPPAAELIREDRDTR